jgi:hypothetical protein
MSSSTRTLLLTAVAALVLIPACTKGEGEQAAASKTKPNRPAKVDEPARAAEPESAGETGEAAEPAKPVELNAPTALVETDSPADNVLSGPPHAGDGFTVGAAVKIEDDGSEEVEIEVTEPLRNGNVVVRVAQHVETDAEDMSIWHLHARVEFDGVDAGAQLNHRRATTVDYAERVLVSSREIAKLDDGRGLVGTWLSGGAGEDSYSTRTDHSVLLIDPSRPSAAVIWTGSESTLSDGGGACSSDSHHEFALEGDALVVTRVESTIADAERMEEMGWAPEDCKAKPKARAKVARIALTKP